MAFTLSPYPEADYHDLPGEWVGAWAGREWGGRSGFWLFRRSEVLRRQANVFFALAMLALAGPLMVLITVAMRMLSSGPVLSREVRVGIDRRLPVQGLTRWRRTVDRGGRLFTLYGFRTTPRTRQISGDRLTVVEVRGWMVLANLLRRTRLDSLPELLNVLRGDMNVVGPRPQSPGTFAARRKAFHAYPRRQRVLPGMVSPALLGRGGVESGRRESEEVLALELSYVDGRSVSADFRILAAGCVRFLFKPKTR